MCRCCILNLPCDDCGEIIPAGATTNTKHFYAYKELWDKYSSFNDIICLDCFEKRIGRPIEISDLHPGSLTNILYNTRTSKMFTEHKDVSKYKKMVDERITRWEKEEGGEKHRETRALFNLRFNNAKTPSHNK